MPIDGLARAQDTIGPSHLSQLVVSGGEEQRMSGNQDSSTHEKKREETDALLLAAIPRGMLRVEDVFAGNRQIFSYFILKAVIYKTVFNCRLLGC